MHAPISSHRCTNRITPILVHQPALPAIGATLGPHHIIHAPFRTLKLLWHFRVSGLTVRRCSLKGATLLQTLVYAVALQIFNTGNCSRHSKLMFSAHNSTTRNSSSTWVQALLASPRHVSRCFLALFHLLRSSSEKWPRWLPLPEDDFGSSPTPIIVATSMRAEIPIRPGPADPPPDQTCTTTLGWNMLGRQSTTCQHCIVFGWSCQISLSGNNPCQPSSWGLCYCRPTQWSLRPGSTPSGGAISFFSWAGLRRGITVTKQCLYHRVVEVIALASSN